MLKSIQESIDSYIENQQLTETLVKEIILKEICKNVQKAKKNQIKQILIKEKTVYIKTLSSELKQEILLNKTIILKNIKNKKIDITDLK